MKLNDRVKLTAMSGRGPELTGKVIGFGHFLEYKDNLQECLIVWLDNHAQGYLHPNLFIRTILVHPENATVIQDT